MLSLTTRPNMVPENATSSAAKLGSRFSVCSSGWSDLEWK